MSDAVMPQLLETRRTFDAPHDWSHADVLATLSAGFRVSAGPTQRSKLTWLDSFDWRLHRGGLLLEHAVPLGGVRGGAGRGSVRLEQLRLQDFAGHTIAVQEASARPPTLPTQLDAGPLGAEVGRLLEMRALLAVAAMDVTTRELRLLDSLDKTVVRVVVELALVCARLVPLRIVVAQVRGYPTQAQRAQRLLVAAGCVATNRSQVQVALAAAGRRAGDYSNKIAVELTAAAPAPRSVARLLLAALDGIEANLDGTIRDVDTEFLHDLRVNVRRTRAALKLTGDVLPDGVAQRFEPEFRWLGAVTSPVRDLDVHLLELLDVADSVPGLEPLRQYLSTRRRVERRRLLGALRSERFTTLVRDWRVLLTEVVSHAEPGSLDTGELAARRIRHAHRRLLRRGAAIAPDSPAEQLHSLRKRGKELRYLLEFFASLHDPGAHRKVVDELKALQDVLGRFQDSELQRAALVEFAEQMVAAGTVPAATLLAMGELAARLDSRHAARNEFGARFARFTSERNLRRFALLTESRDREPQAVTS